MRLPRKFLKFDYGLHIVFGVLIGLFIALIPLTEGASVMGLALLWFVIGVWQVLSALILVFGYKDRLRAYYLMAVVVYGILYFLFALGHPIYSSAIFLSVFFAIWYAVLTYKDATYRTPSFWDLEF